MTDVVPKTQTFKQYKQKQAKETAVPKENAPPNGQKTLDSHMGAVEAQATNGASHEIMDVDEEEEAAEEGVAGEAS